MGYRNKLPEIMGPAGSYESLMAAIKAGADSIYFGVGPLNMRAHSAKSFGLEDIKKISDICRENNLKSYLTVNAVIYDEDLEPMRELCDLAKEADVSAVIVTDIATMLYARKLGLRVHASTQLNIANIEAVRYFSQYADALVLARELSLDQISDICKRIKEEDIKGPDGELVKIEVFVHGALCVAVAGKCYMSLAQYARSANRGECLHACRRAYLVIDEETGDELKVDNKYVMSPKDLCTIGMIDKLIDAGIDIFKIEGRGRPPEYVHTTVKVYKEAIQSVKDNTYSKKMITAWMSELDSVFNRGFWENGYYLGKKLGEWAESYGSQATKTKMFIGKVVNYFEEPRVAEVLVQANSLNVDDHVLITGPTTGVVRLKVEQMMKDDEDILSAKKAGDVTLKVPEKVRKNDQVYVIKER